eukprot:CAMPEP_0113936598 /NCGR_PEP_ID=MMETSP1339-20121228/3478_1 /TAXON_ID=94617 /ORGANISM="Fibrocapsa japonica" /LENGTH=227 /DNA_ID=CAMNT_0000939129 /DNA_START=189 /DNA_END=872 /DNA_ORIENTATION=+ /assembly_acc=CAM_ASM_000762
MPCHSFPSSYDALSDVTNQPGQAQPYFQSTCGPADSFYNSSLDEVNFMSDSSQESVDSAGNPNWRVRGRTARPYYENPSWRRSKQRQPPTPPRLSNLRSRTHCQQSACMLIPLETSYSQKTRSRHNVEKGKRDRRKISPIDLTPFLFFVDIDTQGPEEDYDRPDFDNELEEHLQVAYKASNESLNHHAVELAKAAQSAAERATQAWLQTRPQSERDAYLYRTQMVQS